jgi:hypothetical protein
MRRCVTSGSGKLSQTPPAVKIGGAPIEEQKKKHGVELIYFGV